MIDAHGEKRLYQTNSNLRLKTFLEAVNILTGSTYELVSLGDRVFGEDYYNHTLGSLGFMNGSIVNLMALFRGA